MWPGECQTPLPKVGNKVDITGNYYSSGGNHGFPSALFHSFVQCQFASAHLHSLGTDHSFFITCVIIWVGLFFFASSSRLKSDHCNFASRNVSF